MLAEQGQGGFRALRVKLSADLLEVVDGDSFDLYLEFEALSFVCRGTRLLLYFTDRRRRLGERLNLRGCRCPRSLARENLEHALDTLEIRIPDAPIDFVGRYGLLDIVALLHEYLLAQKT